MDKTESWELPENWEEEKPVVDWIKRIKNKKGYKRELALFLRYVEKTPTQAIEERKAQLDPQNSLKVRRTYEQLAINWVSELYSDRKKESTVRGYLRSVQSFFNSQFMPLKFLRNEIKHEEIEEVKQNHKPKWVFDNVELRTMLEFCRSNYDRGLLLSLAHSGMSPIDISQILITDQLLEDIENKRHHYVEKRREKSTILQQTFLSEEALFYIDLYLRERGEYEEGDPLFLTQKGNEIDSKYLHEKYKAIAITAFGEKGEEFKTKNLRDVLWNACKLGDLSEGLTDSLLGWRRKGAKSSYYLNERVIRKAYEKIFKYISINGQTKTRAEFDDLKNAILEQEKQIRGLVTRLDVTTQSLGELEQIYRTTLEIMSDQLPTLYEAVERKGLVGKWLRSKETGKIEGSRLPESDQ